MVHTTPQQRKALKRIFDRNQSKHTTYREFRKSVQPYFTDGVILVISANMLHGIETDGSVNT